MNPLKLLIINPIIQVTSKTLGYAIAAQKAMKNGSKLVILSYSFSFFNTIYFCKNYFKPGLN